jgi:HSP20 family protein
MAEKESKDITVRREPERFVSPLREMERTFEDLFRRPFSLLSPTFWPSMRMEGMEELSLSVDIFEEGDDIVVKAEVPGISKDNLEVSVTDNTITISGEKKKEEKIEKKNYFRMERTYGSFTRSIPIPSEIEKDKIKARFKDGVLEIRAPKTEEAKQQAKKISIE